MVFHFYKISGRIAYVKNNVPVWDRKFSGSYSRPVPQALDPLQQVHQRPLVHLVAAADQRVSGTEILEALQDVPGAVSLKAVGDGQGVKTRRQKKNSTRLIVRRASK